SSDEKGRRIGRRRLGVWLQTGFPASGSLVFEARGDLFSQWTMRTVGRVQQHRRLLQPTTNEAPPQDCEGDGSSASPRCRQRDEPFTRRARWGFGTSESIGLS